MHKRLFLPLAAILLIAAFTVQAQTGEIKLDAKKQTLSNGMRVLVLENHSAPVFSGMIRFNTGSVDERPGITGISHLLEHMLFKGTKIIGTNNYKAEAPLMHKIDSLAHLFRSEQEKLSNPLNLQDSTRLKELRQQMADVQSEQKKYVVKDELWDTYLNNGGTSLNASTGNDGTQYYVSLPKNRLGLWAFLEADRLANLILREFYSERDVVMEERRLSENNPWGKLDEALSATTYWSTPYKWPVLGWMSDIQTVTREEVEAYFKSHYSPSNAVAVIVGDVNAEEVFKICEENFGKIPAQPLPPPVITRDAPQEGERRIEIEHTSNPMAFIAWKIPQIGHPDLPALEVAANILSNGRTSRFYKNIKVKKLGDVWAYAENARYPGTFVCSATPMPDHSITELETAIYAEIDRLKSESVTDWELEKVRNQVDASFIRSLESNMGLCWRLAGSEAVTGNWHHFIDHQMAVKKVTADDIMRVVNKYLIKKNRSVAYIVKTEESKSQPAYPKEG
jgi:predicted Zn-dependent peptidase